MHQPHRVVPADHAIALLHELLRADPHHEEGHFLYAQLLYETEQYEASLKASQLTITIIQDKKDILRLIAGNYSKLKQHQLCIATYTDLLRLHPTDSHAWNNRGYQRNLAGEYAGAIADFDKAIALTPAAAYPHNNRGFAWLQLGNLQAALADIEYSITLDPQNSYSYKNKALYCIATGDMAQAKENLQKAAALGFKEMYGDEVDELLKKLSP